MQPDRFFEIADLLQASLLLLLASSCLIFVFRIDMFRNGVRTRSWCVKSLSGVLISFAFFLPLLPVVLYTHVTDAALKSWIEVGMPV